MVELLIPGAGNHDADWNQRLTRDFNDGLFVEAYSKYYEHLCKNLAICNDRFKVNYKPALSLLSDVEEKVNFNLIGGASSMFKVQDRAYKKRLEKHRDGDPVHLVSETTERFLRRHGWAEKKVHLVLDVQGAELKVLKGFGDLIGNVQSLRVEVSTRSFYRGQVLWPELNRWLLSRGFVLKDPSQPVPEHGDMEYIR